jgi:hypothetical protein
MQISFLFITQAKTLKSTNEAKKIPLMYLVLCYSLSFSLRIGLPDVFRKLMRNIKLNLPNPKLSIL